MDHAGLDGPARVLRSGQHMKSIPRRAARLLAFALFMACDNAAPRAVDTVVLVDTVLRVDTVVLQDADSAVPGPAVSVLPGPGAPLPLASDIGANAAVTDADMAYLRSRRLLIPVAGARAADLPNTFDESRSAGARSHDAIDILASRGTPVLSADAGRVARIDTSDRGGLSLYATDPSGRFVYYYAHLDRYRAGLRDSQPLRRGDTVGYVGTTGNAPPNTPHLHFAISLLGDPRRWWDGTPINPWPLLTAKP